MSSTAARVTSRGAERWVRGHPWIYRSEVTSHPAEPGIVPVEDPRGRFIGQALLSPRSEIRLRLLERTERPVDAPWWHERLAGAIARREGIDATACRLVHGEGDGLPSLVLDRYDRYLVGQLLSAGLDPGARRSSPLSASCSAPRACSCGTTSRYAAERV